LLLQMAARRSRRLGSELFPEHSCLRLS
jgi:hypothetical protein